MADLTGRMIGAMQADVKTFTEIEADPSAMGQAVTVIVIAGVAALIGNFFRSGRQRRGHRAGRVAARLRAVLVHGLHHRHQADARAGDQGGLQRDVPRGRVRRVARRVQRPGDRAVSRRRSSRSSSGIWSLVIAVVAVREVLDYSNTGRAIIVCLIAVVICMIVWMHRDAADPRAMFLARRRRRG